MGIDYIKIFIDFCYEDIENSSASEKTKFFNEIIFELYDFDFQAADRPIKSSEEYWPFFMREQQEALKFLEWFYQSIGNDNMLSFSVPRYLTTGGGNPDETFVYSTHIMPQKKVDHYKLQIIIVRNLADHDLLAQKIQCPLIAFRFLESLDGKRVEGLLRCPKCKKIYFNSTKRKQVYCSPQCRILSGVHRARKKERDIKKTKSV